MLNDSLEFNNVATNNDTGDFNNDVNIIDNVDLTGIVGSIKKLQKDLSKVSQLSTREIRYLVDTYYRMQEMRKSTGNQIFALNNLQEPNELIDWFYKNTMVLEGELKKMLQAYSETKDIGRWMMSLRGVGPVISAGMISWVDVKKASTAGAVWRFAGVEPSAIWLSKKEAENWLKGKEINEQTVADAAVEFNKKFETLLYDATHKYSNKKVSEIKLTRDSLVNALIRRPWNQKFKVLCWKFADCIVKHNGTGKVKVGNLYHRLYAQRKAYEENNNQNFAYADLAEKRMSEVAKSTEAYKYYKKGQLPPAHITSRVYRWMAKIFLAHLHEKMYWKEFNCPPPNPYVLEHMGHKDKVSPPESEYDREGVEYTAKEAAEIKAKKAAEKAAKKAKK